ncbi:uncharacterized protein J3R85_013509 [Psidium guajava]|nr:uncharacterized protein J3R85_013509 [Psidium guajava]
MLEVTTAAQKLKHTCSWFERPVFSLPSAPSRSLANSWLAYGSITGPTGATRFPFTTFVALAFGLMFWDLGSRTKRLQDLFNAMGSMYAAVFFLGIQNSAVASVEMTVSPTEKEREKGGGGGGCCGAGMY